MALAKDIAMFLQIAEHEIVADCIALSNGKHKDSSFVLFHLYFDYLDPW